MDCSEFECVCILYIIMLHSKNRYVMRGALSHSSVKITWKFVISTRKLVTLI